MLPNSNFTISRGCHFNLLDFGPTVDDVSAAGGLYLQNHVTADVGALGSGLLRYTECVCNVNQLGLFDLIINLIINLIIRVVENVTLNNLSFVYSVIRCKLEIF